MVQAHGTLDVLVNNAAIWDRVPFADIDRAAYRRMLDINLTTPFFLTQGLLPALHQSKNASVINIFKVR